MKTPFLYPIPGGNLSKLALYGLLLATCITSNSSISKAHLNMVQNIEKAHLSNKKLEQLTSLSDQLRVLKATNNPAFSYDIVTITLLLNQEDYQKAGDLLRADSTLSLAAAPVPEPKKGASKISNPTSGNTSAAAKKGPLKTTPKPSPTTQASPAEVKPIYTNSALAIQGIFDETNNERAKAGLLPLTPNNLLNKAAAEKLEDMLSNHYFAHISPTGVSYTNFVNNVSYSWHSVSENLAWGDPQYLGDAAVVQLWMNSPGHKANILSTNTEIGIAVSQTTYDGKNGWIAVQLFGTP